MDNLVSTLTARARRGILGLSVLALLGAASLVPPQVAQAGREHNRYNSCAKYDAANHQWSRSNHDNCPQRTERLTDRGGRAKRATSSHSRAARHNKHKK